MKKLGIVCLWAYLVGVFVSIGVLLWSILSPRTYMNAISKWLKRLDMYT